MRERGTLVVSLALLGGLAVGSWWLAEEARRFDTVPRKLTHDIDYYADKITLTRMDEKGRAQYTIDADHMVHFADDDSGELTRPRVVGVRADRPEMRIHADLGKTSNESQEVRLFGNVEMRRAAAPGLPELLAKGPYLMLLPEQEIVKTDQPFVVTQAGSRITARDMQYDNGDHTLHMDGGKDGRVHAVIEPRNTRGAAREAGSGTETKAK